MKPFRIVNLTTFYPVYLKGFYRKNPLLENESFAEQQKVIFDDLFGWSDFLPRNFRKLGHEALEIVANAERLQKQWAKERNLAYSKNTWPHEIVVAQLKEFKPDILFVEDCLAFTATVLRKIKAEVPCIKFVILHHGIRDTGVSSFKEADLVLTCFRWLAKKLEKQNIKSAVLNHAFETSILEELKKQDQLHGVSFVGSCYLPSHQKRLETLKYLSKKIPVSIWTPSLNRNLWSLAISGLKSILKCRIKQFIEEEANPSIRRCFRGEAFGREMYQILYNSKITVNIHIEDAQNEASNMRLFEATGVGTCLVTDWTDHLGELFDPGREVVTFRSPDECVEKVRWLLDHPKERETIARAGQARTLRDHTFRHRAIQLVELIKTHTPEIKC